MRSGYKQSEVGAIPEEWDVFPVEQKGEVVTGKALAINEPGRQRPYLRTKNVFDGRIDIDDVLTMPMTDEQFVHFGVRMGDVLLNEGQSLELVGRCAMYQEEYPEPCAIQNQLIRFRARPGVSGLFASYLFRYCQQTGVFARIALQTTSIAHLGGSRFGRLLLAWPKSEAEQRNIAEALSNVDALLGALDRLIAKKRDLKQAAMQQLLTGQTRLPSFHGEWKVKRLGEIGQFRNGINKAKEDFGHGYPFANLMDVFGVAKVSNSSSFGLVNSTSAERDLYELRRGDVLFVRSSVKPSGVGLTTLIQEDLPNTVFSGFLLRFRDEGALTVEYKEHCFGEAGFREKLIASSTVSANTNINQVSLRALTLKFPIDTAEQTAIANVLREMQAELAGLEQRRAKTRALKEGMMQELLTGRTRLVSPKESRA
jgi:type I restriction enzyme S subunit